LRRAATGRLRCSRESVARAAIQQRGQQHVTHVVTITGSARDRLQRRACSYGPVTRGSQGWCASSTKRGRSMTPSSSFRSVFVSGQRTPMSSTSNTSVARGGITGGKPRSP
jgi:hypothetical protein